MKTFMGECRRIKPFCMILIVAALFVMMTAAAYAEEEPVLYVRGVQVTEQNSPVKLDSNGWYCTASYDEATSTLTISRDEKKAKTHIKPQLVAEGSTPEGEGIDEGALYAGIYATGIPHLTINLDETCFIIDTAGESGSAYNARRYAGIFVEGDLTVTGEGLLEVSVGGNRRRHIYASGDITVGENVFVRCGNVSDDNTKQIGIEAGGDITIEKGGAVSSLLGASSNTSISLQKAIVCGGTLTASGKLDLPSYFAEEYPNDYHSGVVDGTVNAATGSSKTGSAVVIQADKVAASGDSTLKIKVGRTNEESVESTGIDADLFLSDSASATFSLNGYGNDLGVSVGLTGNLNAADKAKVRFSSTMKTGVKLSDSEHFVIGENVKAEISGRDVAIDNMKLEDLPVIRSIGALVSMTTNTSDAVNWDGGPDFSNYKYISIPVMYELWISGKRVDGGNKSDVLDDGTVQYDPTTKALTLNGANLTTEMCDGNLAAVYSRINDLTIKLEENNLINSGSALRDTFAGIKADGDGMGTLTIDGTGSLDMRLSAGNSAKNPSGIIANDVNIQNAGIDITIVDPVSIEGTTSVNNGNVVGVYSKGNVKVKDADLGMMLSAGENGIVTGIYVDDVKNSTYIEGDSKVDIALGQEGDKTPWIVTGISTSYYTGDPLYNRDNTKVYIKDTARLNINTTDATSKYTNGGIYGWTYASGNSEIKVKAGDANYSYGIAIFPQKTSATSPSDQYITAVYASNYSHVSLKSKDWAALSSVEASGNAIVDLDGGKSGTYDYQGAKISGDAKLTAKGGNYGISGILQVNGNGVVELTGGDRAIRGMDSPSAVSSGYKPFEVSENDGKVVDLRTHLLKTAMVKADLDTQQVTVWNGTDDLGGSASTFKYVRIPDAHECTPGEPVHENEVTASCTKDGSYDEVTYCVLCGKELSREAKTVPVEGHKWDSGKVTKDPTTKVEGVKIYKCSVCGETKTEAIPKLSAGEAIVPGASAAAADEVIKAMKNDKDPKGSKYLPLQLKSTKQTKTSVTIKWTKQKKAVKYVIYGNMCGSKNKMKKLATVSTGSKTFKKVAGKKVKKGKAYKFILVALDKNNKVVSTSKVAHAYTKGGKFTNHKAVKVQLKSGKKWKAVKTVTVKKGKTRTIRGVGVKQLAKKKIKMHVPMRYESSKTAVAIVTAKGLIKGIKKGTCYVYAFSNNGVAKKIKVTVK